MSHAALLLTAYFHQDWTEEFETPREAVRAFREGEGAAAAESARRELAHIIASKNDLELSTWLNRLGVYVNLDYYKLSPRQWLSFLLEELAD